MADLRTTYGELGWRVRGPAGSKEDQEVGTNLGAIREFVVREVHLAEGTLSYQPSQRVVPDVFEIFIREFTVRDGGLAEQH